MVTYLHNHRRVADGYDPPYTRGHARTRVLIAVRGQVVSGDGCNLPTTLSTGIKLSESLRERSIVDMTTGHPAHLFRLHNLPDPTAGGGCRLVSEIVSTYGPTLLRQYAGTLACNLSITVKPAAEVGPTPSDAA